MASAVATPLEKQFSTIAGHRRDDLEQRQGRPRITLQFALDRNIDAAAQDVQAAIAQTLAPLPQDMLPPTYQKVNPADSPDPLLRAHLDARCRCSQLDEYAETILAQRHLDGRRRGAGAGVRLPEVRGARPARSAGAGRAADRHRRGGRRPSPPATSTCRPASSGAPTRRMTVEANGQLHDAAAFRPLVVAYRERRAGAPRGPGPGGRRRAGQPRSASWYNGTRGDRARHPAPAGHQHRRGGRRRRRR